MGANDTHSRHHKTDTAQGVGLVQSAYSLEQPTVCDNSVASRMQWRTGGTAHEDRGQQNHNEKEVHNMKTVKRFVAIAF